MSNAVKIYKHFQTPKDSGVYHRLICLTGEKKGTAYFIMDKKRVVLGRGESADVRVLDLKSSREHAEIIQVGEEFVLTDLGSQNGIIVNEKKIKQHVLINGDKIIIGKTVYKFSRIVVKSNQSNDEEEDDEEEDNPSEEGDKNLTKILFGIILLAFIVWGLEGTKDTKVEGPPVQEGKLAINKVDDEIVNEIKNTKKRSEKNREKLSRYFHRGLREYREGNYFRAYIEFENARGWDPKDPTANFYVRKTKEKQNEIITSYFSKGSRDKDALNYTAAATAYCTIVRLLVYHFPNDERIKQARDNIRELELKMGKEEGSIVCIRKDDES